MNKINLENKDLVLPYNNEKQTLYYYSYVFQFVGLIITPFCQFEDFWHMINGTFLTKKPLNESE